MADCVSPFIDGVPNDHFSGLPYRRRPYVAQCFPQVAGPAPNRSRRSCDAGAALYALGFLATLVIAVFSDFDTAEAVVLMMLPSTLLAIFEAGAVWGRRNAPLQVAGGTTASRPSAFSD